MELQAFVEKRFGGEGLELELEEELEEEVLESPDHSDSGLGWRESLLAKAGIPKKSGNTVI